MQNFYFRSKMLVIIMIGILSLTACSMYPVITPAEKIKQGIDDQHNIALNGIEIESNIVHLNMNQLNGEQGTELNKITESIIIEGTNLPENPLNSDIDFSVDFEKQPIIDITEEIDEQPKSSEQVSDDQNPVVVEENVKVIALTFDDGPDANYTPQVLDILKEKGVKATFFIVGIQINKYPEVVQRMVDEGHLIANHTYSHPNLKKLTKAQILEELNTTDELIESIVGFRPNIVRPPYGSINNEVRAVIEEAGKEVVMWNIDPRDWDSTPVKEMYDNVMTNARDQGNILFHSFGGKQIQNTVDLLPQIIDALTAEGYTFVTADYYLD